MSRFFIIIIISLIIQACTSKGNLPSTTPTHEAILTKAPTDAPPTPTETTNPDMPFDATRRNEAGEWIKETAEGAFIWTEIKNNKNEEVVSLWTKSHVLDSPANLDGGIPIDDVEGEIKRIPLDINIQEDVEGPYFRHPAPSKSDNMGGFFFPMVYKNHGSGKSLQEFYEIYKTGSIPLGFTDVNGNEYVWNIGGEEEKNGNGRYRFFGIEWNHLTQEHYPDFVIIETTDIPDKTPVYRWTAFTDEKNNLIVLGAVEHTEALSNEEWMTFILGPLGPISTRHTLGPEIAYFPDTRFMVRTALANEIEITLNP
jgi:hypothetical protein